MTASRANKRYQFRVLVLMIAYAAILIGVVSYARSHYPLSGPFGFVLGALPALPIVGVIAAMLHYIVEEPDEYIRLVFARQMLVATGVTLALATTWGFLENFGLVPHVYGYYAVMIWFGCQGLWACWHGLNRAFARGEA